MKPIIVAMLICLAACNSQEKIEERAPADTASEVKPASPENATVPEEESAASISKQDSIKKQPTTFSNKRFKDVTISKKDDSTWLIKGKAQVFEAAFSWVIEDGHDELQKGFSMTDAGAPEWGNFSFTVKARKKRSHSVLHLILFESSAKDGSRQYLLPILLN